MGSHRRHRIHRHHRLTLLIHRHRRVLLAHQLGEFGYMFQTQPWSQQTRDSHPIRLLPLEEL
jgi:hypothetical protein